MIGERGEKARVAIVVWRFLASRLAFIRWATVVICFLWIYLRGRGGGRGKVSSKWKQTLMINCMTFNMLYHHDDSVTLLTPRFLGVWQSGSPTHLPTTFDSASSPLRLEEEEALFFFPRLRPSALAAGS